MNVNVDHCERCRKMFQVTYSKYCPDCLAFVRTEVERCAAHLRANKESTLQELSEAAEVPLSRLIHYINDGKLYVYDYPNLTFGCYFCGSEIKRGYLCTPCASKLKLEVKDLYLREGYEYDTAANQIRPRVSLAALKDTFTVQGRKQK